MSGSPNHYCCYYYYFYYYYYCYCYTLSPWSSTLVQCSSLPRTFWIRPILMADPYGDPQAEQRRQQRQMAARMDARTRGIIMQVAEEEQHAGPLEVPVPTMVLHCVFCSAFTTSASIRKCLSCKRPCVVFRLCHRETEHFMQQQRGVDEVHLVRNSEGRVAVRALRRHDATEVLREASRRIAAQAAEAENM